MKRVYLLASVGAAALVSACGVWDRSTDREQSLSPQTEIIAFFNAVVSNSPDGYRHYLESYPSGRYCDIALDLLTTCTSGTCASDTQLQVALLNAVAIARGQGASGVCKTAVEQRPTESPQPAIATAPESSRGDNY
jgi:hypothetical protein